MNYIGDEDHCQDGLYDGSMKSPRQSHAIPMSLAGRPDTPAGAGTAVVPAPVTSLALITCRRFIGLALFDRRYIFLLAHICKNDVSRELPKGETDGY